MRIGDEAAAALGHRMAVKAAFDGSRRPFEFENAFAAARKGAGIRGCNMLEGVAGWSRDWRCEASYKRVT